MLQALADTWSTEFEWALTTAASQHLLLLLLPCRSSPRIFNLVLLVMGYGTAHKLFGFVWKGQMKVSTHAAAASARCT
jgi:hypothetical protein